MRLGASSVDEIRIWPTLRDTTDVVSDYLDGRYEGSGTWTSPEITFPGGERVRFVNANWTEHLPDGITSDIELTFEVWDGATLVLSKPFDAPSLSNNLLVWGTKLQIVADLSASSSGRKGPASAPRRAAYEPSACSGLNLPKTKSTTRCV